MFILLPMCIDSYDIFLDIIVKKTIARSKIADSRIDALKAGMTVDKLTINQSDTLLNWKCLKVGLK